MEWVSWGMALYGALGIVALVVVARVMRKGLSRYGDRRKAMVARIRETQATIQDGNQAESVASQLALLDAAVRELISLGRVNADWQVRREGSIVTICKGTGAYHIRYVPKQAALRSQRRILHGAGHWELREDDSATTPQTFTTVDALLRHLATCQQGQSALL